MGKYIKTGHMVHGEGVLVAEDALGDVRLVKDLFGGEWYLVIHEKPVSFSRKIDRSKLPKVNLFGEETCGEDSSSD